MARSRVSAVWSYIQGVAIVTGTIIGAGVLGVPYAIMQLGVVPGLLLLVLVGFCMGMVMLYVTDVAQSLPGRHQLTAYFEKYLGRRAKHILMVALAINIYGALLGYTIGQGAVLSGIFPGTDFVWSLLFFATFSLFIVFGIHAIKRVEVFLTGLIALLFVGILVLLVPAADEPFSFLYTNGSAANTLQAYGVLLFAFFGLTAVPQVKEIMVGQSTGLMRAAIMMGVALPTILYGLFAFFVIAITGAQTSQIATLALGDKLGLVLVSLGSILAFLAMAGSFIALGLALRTILVFDYRVPVPIAIVVTLGVPLVLFASGIRDFITVISFVGGFSLSLIGMVSVLMHWQLSRTNQAYQPSFVAVATKVLVFGVFLFGILATIVGAL